MGLSKNGQRPTYGNVYFLKNSHNFLRVSVPPVLGGVGYRRRGIGVAGFRHQIVKRSTVSRAETRGSRNDAANACWVARCRGGRPIGGCTPRRSWAAATGGCPGLWRARGPPRSPKGRLFPLRQPPAGTACFGQTRCRWWCAYGRWRAEGHRRGPPRLRGGLCRRARPGWSGWRQLPAGHRATGALRQHFNLASGGVKFMWLRGTLTLTRAPASWKTRAQARSIGAARTRKCPETHAGQGERGPGPCARAASQNGPWAKMATV